MNQLEEIHYDLGYFGDNPHIEQWLVIVISKLPQKVQDFALNECLYISVGGTNWGMVMPPDWQKRHWLILLEESLPKGNEESIIAHEIAHAYLGHNRLGNADKKVELEATQAAISWGFSGIGADKEYLLDLYPELGKVL